MASPAAKDFHTDLDAIEAAITPRTRAIFVATPNNPSGVVLGEAEVDGLAEIARRRFNERVLKVDDPCGAISVHGYCGTLGGICVGIFADGTYGAGWNGVGATTYWISPDWA